MASTSSLDPVTNPMRRPPLSRKRAPRFNPINNLSRSSHPIYVARRRALDPSAVTSKVPYHVPANDLSSSDDSDEMISKVTAPNNNSEPITIDADAIDTTDTNHDHLLEEPNLTAGQKRKRDEEDELTRDWNKMIQVLVGSKERSFWAYENIIRRIPFFDACLNSDMVEAQERIVRLPEDSASAFAELLYFVNHNKLQNALATADQRIRTGTATRQQATRNVVKLYCLAKKYMVDDLEVAVLADIKACMRYKCFASWEIMIIEGSVEKDDPLREFALKSVSQYISHLGEWSNFEKENKIKYQEEKYQDVAPFIIEALIRYPIERLP